MITKVVTRRQVEDGKLTNIQTIIFDHDYVLSANLDNTPDCANQIEMRAQAIKMTVVHKVAKLDNVEIHTSTWTNNNIRN